MSSISEFFSERRILILGTGGTIAGRASTADDHVGYTAAQVTVADLLTGIDAPAGVVLVSEQVAQVDSKDMDFPLWCALAQRCAQALADPQVHGLVITHGTDTLEETAFFLHRVLPPAAKPVVLTCAMRPATALAPDGPQNLRDAVAVAMQPGAHGVSVLCAGTLHGAVEVQKLHTYRLDAFDSGDAGPIGYVEEGRLRLTKPWPEPPAIPMATEMLDRLAKAARPPRVEILASHADASGALIDLLVQERSTDPRDAVQGLVLAATGNGTVHHALEAAALRAQAAGIAVLRATRCAQGRILPREDDRLRNAGALSPVKARIELMLELFAASVHTD